MGKPKRSRVLKDNEAQAVLRMVRTSPRKLNLVAQLIRGKKVAVALADLEFSQKRIARRSGRRCRARSPMRRTTISSTSTISSSPRRMSARRL